MWMPSIYCCLAKVVHLLPAFDAEIAPLTVQYEDPKTSTWSEVTVTKDDGVCAGVTAESLSHIKPAFAKDSSIHGGNASIIGVAPLLMGVGPWTAIPLTLENVGITKGVVDVWEINGAFSS
ncbi:hypothetical protein VE03_00796 [Pseudogymnoascus sp. 23342-1-I1]|nr:hypothetical protein VE03_00796 [Pseudogymnoascus sp. 23342-1-I1]